MQRLSVRAGLGPMGARLAVVAALALAGCESARNPTEARPWGRPGVWVAEQPSGKEPAVATSRPQAKVAHKVAETPKAGTKSAAAKEPPARASTDLDEAGCTNVEACASVLKAMVADPERAWMQRPAPPAVLANGVRLFAYRALRPRLTCGELAAASAEVETGANALKGGVPGLQPDKADRARSLSVEVGHELQAETARRCASGSRGGVIGSMPDDRPDAPRTVLIEDKPGTPGGEVH
jgi:hypothetical protein